MSSIITSILSSTVGLLFNKARDKTAAQLKDGDITDTKLREIVVRELNDIKAKLDGISRKDLLSSYRFLKEGVDLLNVSLGKPKDEKKAVLNEARAGGGETSRMPSGVESGILNETLELSYAMGKLKIHSEEFVSAKKRFEEARKRATDAFCNEALSIEDRILAAKFRMISEILECLETPETAVTGCLSFLRDFHSLPAIREMFSVYINGGVKSLLNKAERVENVKYVMLINYVLFQFVWNFSNQYSSPSVWPKIELSDRIFYPILNWQEISTRKSMTMGGELTQPPKCDVLLDEVIDPYFSAVNSHREIVVKYGDDIKVISMKTGESKVVKLADLREGEVIKQDILGLAVDKNNNVYVVKWIKTRTENGNVEISHVLYVLDENYNVKHDCRLDFVKSIDHCPVKIAVNKNNDIIMIKSNERHVYVCDNTGQLKHKFERDSRLAHMSLSISDKNEIMIPSDGDKTVLIYTEEGDMKSSIKVPEGHKVRGVAFHHVISEIIVLSWFREQDAYFLLCFSETGELETSTFFYKSDRLWPNITSHPGGPVAVVREKTVTFI